MGAGPLCFDNTRGCGDRVWRLRRRRSTLGYSLYHYHRDSRFDPEKVRHALATIPVYTIKGPYKADEQGLSLSANVTGHINYQIQNGKRVILWPEYMTEAKFLPMPKWEDRAKK